MTALDGASTSRAYWLVLAADDPNRRNWTPVASHRSLDAIPLRICRRPLVNSILALRPEEQTLVQKRVLDEHAYLMKRKEWLFRSGRSDLFDQKMSSGSPAASKARGPNSVQPPAMVVLKIKDIEEERRVPGVKVERDQGRHQLRILNESGQVVGEYPLDKVEYWSVEA